MSTQTFETSGNPTLTITECLGDLSIKGSDEAMVTVKVSGDEENITFTQEDNAFAVSARTDCKITCPHGTTVTVDVVRGDFRIKGVHGPLTVGEVNGDAVLRDVADTTADRIHGNLSARPVAGNLTAGSIAGDARIEDVSGSVTAGQIGSDLKAGGITGGLTANAVGSDVRLSGPFTPGATFKVRAGSDLSVVVPEDANLRFTFQAGGGVHANVPGIDLVKEGGTVVGMMGEGAATLEAQVGGRVLVKTPGTDDEYPQHFDFDFDFSFLEGLEEIGPMIEARVAEAMADLDVRLSESLRHIDGDRIRMHIEHAAEKAGRAAERVAERAREVAEREAERARRTAEREAERARMRAEHAERRWQRASGYRPPEPPTPFTPPTPPAPAAPPEPPVPPTVSDEALREERLQVLRMVEQGTITPEEAAKLLAALR